jgi:hypothetical protein
MEFERLYQRVWHCIVSLVTMDAVTIARVVCRDFTSAVGTVSDGPWLPSPPDAACDGHKWQHQSLCEIMMVSDCNEVVCIMHVFRYNGVNR